MCVAQIREHAHLKEEMMDTSEQMHWIMHIKRTFTYVFRQLNVVSPKVKILVAMLQVQNGITFTFQVTLPQLFVKFLQDIALWDINLPLDCFVRVGYMFQLIYRTAWPLTAGAILFVMAWYFRKAGEPLRISHVLD